MTRAAMAGFAYFAIVFAIGFALGVARTLWLVPRLGETTAVLIELPVMLAVSWLACVAIVRWRAVARHAAARLVMGGIAFALLMAAELGTGILALGRSLPEQLALYARPPAALGLAAQAAFALMPWLELARRRGSGA